MSYQPPGPYPIFPQQQGTAGMPYGQKPPMPTAVRRAFALMLVGAGLEVVNVALSLMLNGEVERKISEHIALATGTMSTNSGVTDISSVFGGAIGIGLWIWMAFANRAGRNWARITGTVFFGISCLSILGDLAFFSLVHQWLGSVVFILIGENALSWLVGLVTVILLWRAESSGFFRPQQMAAYPYPYPYPPMPGYGAPGFAGPGSPAEPVTGDAVPQQQPADPWATPRDGS